MRILVTGGAGFIGSHLVRWLVEEGHRVRVFDAFRTGKREHIAPFLDDIELIEGDIRDQSSIRAAAENQEIVFHLAALISVEESIQQPLLAHDINATGSLQVLDAARMGGVGRVVQMSSSAVYGNTTDLPVSETAPPEPLSGYAASKLAAEYYGQLYSNLYGLETVAIRGFNIYGPRQDPSSPYASVIPRFIDALKQGRQPTIFGDGNQSRDFVFVGDVVQALWTAATTPNIGGRVYNIGRGQTTSVLQLAHTIGTLLNIKVEPIFAPPRSGEVRHSCADVSRLAEDTGFRPLVGLHDGLEQTIEE